MTTASTKLPAVKALPLTRGQAFKAASMVGFELTGSELELLDEIAGLLDEINELSASVSRDGLTVTGSTGQVRVHPALGELRQHRLALGRLLAQLGLPDEEGDTVPTFISSRARAAAQKRWAGNRG